MEADFLKPILLTLKGKSLKDQYEAFRNDKKESDSNRKSMLRTEIRNLKVKVSGISKLTWTNSR